MNGYQLKNLGKNDWGATKSYQVGYQAWYHSSYPVNFGLVGQILTAHPSSQKYT